jgi:Sugar (and other) transporter
MMMSEGRRLLQQQQQHRRQESEEDDEERNRSNAKQQQPKEPPIRTIGVLMVFLVPALGGFLYGYDIGATSFVLTILLQPPQPQRATSGAMDVSEPMPPDSWWTCSSGIPAAAAAAGCASSSSLEPWKQGLIVSAVALGALLGSHLVLFHLSSRLVGRRTELRIAAALYATGTGFCVLSGAVPVLRHSLGLWVLVLGRPVFGMGVGFVMRTCILILFFCSCVFVHF